MENVSHRSVIRSKSWISPRPVDVQCRTVKFESESVQGLVKTLHYVIFFPDY